jgi:hypothetical protein
MIGALDLMIYANALSFWLVCGSGGSSMTYADLQSHMSI